MMGTVPLRKQELPISLNESEFIRAAVSDGMRVDGRGPYELRHITMQCGRTSTTGGHVELCLGDTRVLAVVSCEAIEPFPDRPTEGFFVFQVEFSPMASPLFEPGRPNDKLTADITRVIERGLKEGRAVDTESLCIVGGKRVWSLRVDCHVLSHAGNLVDACALATIGALLSYRRPDVTVDGEGEITIHPIDEREPVPLSIHHIPIAVSFADFGTSADDTGGIDSGGGGAAAEQQRLICDPSLKEELVMNGRITFTLNPHQELCVVQKSGGAPMMQQQILRCAHLASLKVEEMHTILQAALKAAEALRNSDQKRRRPGIGPPRAATNDDPNAIRAPRPSEGFSVGGGGS